MSTETLKEKYDRWSKHGRYTSVSKNSYDSLPVARDRAARRAKRDGECIYVIVDDIGIMPKYYAMSKLDLAFESQDPKFVLMVMKNGLVSTTMHGLKKRDEDELGILEYISHYDDTINDIG